MLRTRMPRIVGAVAAATGLALLLVTLAARPVLANVKLENGNFFVGFTDATAPGGLEMAVERVYNSKTDFRGMFGSGWGTTDEAFITIRDDGSVIVHEYGGGAENVFEPTASNRRPLPDIEDQIMAAAERSGMFADQRAKDAYRATLDEHHAEEWTKLQSAGLLPVPHLPPGASFVSGRFSHQTVTRTADGYVRRLDDGKVETFDLDGHMRKLADANGNFITFAYDARGRLSTMTDNFGHIFTFVINDAGLVTRLTDWRGKTATYDYRGTDLVRSTDVDGNTFRYQYDAARRHNMTQIAYGDGTTREIAYYPIAQSEDVRRVKEPDGTVTTYRYKTAKGNPERRDVFVTVTDPAQHPPTRANSTYTYFIRRDAAGDTHTERIVTVIDGEKTDTRYDSNGYPVAITNGGDTTRFEYDAQGHVTMKQTSEITTRMTYDRGKVATVSETPAHASQPSLSASYTYDERLNLIGAKDSKNHDLVLAYDDNGRIKQISDRAAGTMLDFTYNAWSKPATITLEGTGTITVTYDNNGEIQKVDSAAGREISLRVTALFQELLEVVRPAGVSLSM